MDNVDLFLELSEDGRMQQRRYVRFFLIVPALITFYFVFQIFRPFLMPITLAIIFASLCYPVFRQILKLCRGRRSLAAFLTSIALILVVIVPLAGFLVALADEVGQVYRYLQEKAESGEINALLDMQEYPFLAPVVSWVGQYVELEKIDIVGNLTTVLRTTSVFLLRQSTSLLGEFASFLTKLLIMMITVFFLFRDGANLAREVKTLTPLSVEYEEMISKTFKEVTRATVIGTLLTAIAQGVAGGLVFWIVGIPKVFFWSASMALFSMVPVVGTTVVWIPWTVYLLLTGSWVKAIILAALCALVVGGVDNVIRPLFIEGRVGMHTLLVFFSIMGGISYFGMIGIILGPITVALGLTFIKLYKSEFQKELLKPE